MKRVSGIGGIFFKVKDAEGMRAWYKNQHGLVGEGGGGLARLLKKPSRHRRAGLGRRRIQLGWR
jgi:hypothetical protein